MSARLGVWFHGMCCSLLVLVVAPAAVAGELAWASMGVFKGTNGIPGVNDQVYAAACDAQGNLYVAGLFSMAGNVPANRVAKWDGTRWSALGGGMDGYVNFLAPAPDGTVYAGGSFNSADAVSCRGLARWNGTEWRPCGDTSWLSSLSALAVDNQGRVYIGGSFNSPALGVNNIAMWADSAWSSLGGGTSAGGTVSALACDANGNLYAGGGFTNISGVPVNYYAKWNGTTWSAMGPSPGCGATTMACDPQGNVWVGGSGSGVAKIVKWDGSTWRVIPNGPDSNYISGFAFDVFGNTYVCGPFYTLGGQPATKTKYFAKWDGSTWTSYGDGSVMKCLAQDSSGYIYVGGVFSSIDGQAASNVARWDGSFFYPLSSEPIEGIVNVARLDAKGALYVGGQFVAVDKTPASRIARWTGSGWSSLGSGFPAPVKALATALYPNNKTYVFAGGHFTGTMDCGAYWDGSKWTELLYGMPGPVESISVTENGNTLCMGGYYDGGLYVCPNWQARRETLTGPALALCRDTAGNLYVGGKFTSAGNVAGTENIARLSGTTWSPIVPGGVGANGPVYAVAVDGGRLYIGGDFTQVNGVNAAHIAMCEGGVWQALGAGCDGEVRALAPAPYGGLVAAGAFRSAGGVQAERIAFWDGKSWTPLGSGLDGRVLTLALATNGILYVGGEFKTAGGVSSPYFAKVDIGGLSQSPEVIRLRAMTPAGSGAWTLLFDSVKDNRYRIQYGGSVTGPWATLASDLVATSSAASWLDQGPPSTTQIHPADVTTRFYRVMKVK